MDPSLRETFFKQEEWKYIQAVLKYRLDLHFYASQGRPFFHFQKHAKLVKFCKCKGFFI